MHQHLPYRGNHSGRGTFQYFAGPWFKQCRNILDLVGTIAFLTRLATTPRHVFSQESYELGEAASKGQQHAFARKGEPELPQMLGSRISISTALSRVDDRRIKVTAIGLPVLIQAWYQRQGCQGHAWRTHTGTRRKRTFTLEDIEWWWWPLKSETGGATRWSNQPSNFIRMPAEARARSSLPPLQAASFQFWCLAGPPSTSSLRCQPLFADLSLHHNLGGDPPPLRCLLFHTSPPHQQVSSQPGNERVDLFIPCEGLISRVPFIKRVRAAQ